MKALKIAASVIDAPWDIQVDRFDGGTATILDDSRTKKKFVRESINVWQEQDGIWATRPGTAYYGEIAADEAGWLGVAEYERTDGVREMVAIGSTTGKAYKSVDGGAWTVISGATFNTTKKPRFLQINSLLYIVNGADKLTRYNGTSLTRYTALSAPTGLSASRGAGLSAGAYPNYYKVTALNDVGETIGSAEASVTTNIQRDSWAGASNQYVDLSWTAVAGAVRYLVYYALETGKELLLDEAPSNSYRDDNTAAVNPYVPCPNDDTTGAPIFSMIGISGNRIWGVDAVNHWRVHWSGVGQYLGYFSPYYQGGWIDLELGGREKPTWVGHYRSGKGDEATTVLCRTPEGTGAAWQIQLVDQTVGALTYLVPIATKIVGTVGTRSPDAVVKAIDAIIFPNDQGIFNFGNKPNITNVLATDELSQNIRPSYLGLNKSRIEDMCAYYRNSRVFFSAAESSEQNDIIFVLDLERNNWAWKWTIGVRQFLEYTDADGHTHFVGVPYEGTRLWEFDENVLSDLGKPFYQSIITGLLPVVENDPRAFANVHEGMVELGRPKGVVNFAVSGTERKRGYSEVASRQIADSAPTNEFWTGGLGEITLKDEEDAPKTYAQADVKKTKKVNRDLNNIQFHVYANAADTRFSLLRFSAVGSLSPSDTPSGWRK